jgi:hypothetical protein
MRASCKHVLFCISIYFLKLTFFPFCFSYKDIKEEKSQAFGFSKIKNAIPSFESYLEEELAEYVRAYAHLDERAQNLIATKPLLSAIRKNPVILSNYQNGIANWQRDASNLSVTGGGFISKLPIRNCVLPLQQKLRSLVLKQLVSFHEMKKNNIGLEVTSAAWNFRSYLERATAMQLFDQVGPSYSLPRPSSNDSAQDIYSVLKEAALARISQATLPVRKKLFDLMVGLIPSAVVASEEFSNRKFLQEAIFEKIHKTLSDELVSALIAICEPWDSLVQGFCTLHSFSDVIKQCTSIDVSVLLHTGGEDLHAKGAVAVAEQVKVTLEIGDIAFDFPRSSAKIRKDSESDDSFGMAMVPCKATTTANVLSDGFFSMKALQMCLKRIQEETDKVKKHMKNIPGMDYSKLPEILKIVSATNANTQQALKIFSEKIRAMMAQCFPLFSAVQQEMATKLDDVRAIAQKDQAWNIHSSQFFKLQKTIREANSSLMRELQVDHEPLQALTEIYNDQFMCSPQHQIQVDFGSSKDAVSTIHSLASSPWFTSIDTSDDKEQLSLCFIQQLKHKFDDVKNSVKRLEGVCRRIKDSANDFAQSPTQRSILSKLCARIFKAALVENSLKLSFAPFGYSFCKLMTEKKGWEQAKMDADFKSNLRDVLQRFISLDFLLTFLIRADFSNPLKIISESPKAAGSPLTAEALSLVAFSIDPPNVPFLADTDAVLDGKGDLNKFYGGRFVGQQPLSVFSIKSSLHKFLVSWHSFFRPGKLPSKDYLEFKARITIKKLLTSSEKMMSFRVDAQDVFLIFRDLDGKSEKEQSV